LGFKLAQLNFVDNMRLNYKGIKRK